MRLHIGNLTKETTAEQLMDVARRFGTVTSAEIVSDRKTGVSRGYGFVIFENPAGVTAATRGLDGTVINGQAIRLG